MFVFFYLCEHEAISPQAAQVQSYYLESLARVNRQPPEETVLSANGVYILYEDVIYQVESLFKAANISFKVFFVFNAGYPSKVAGVDLPTVGRLVHYDNIMM